MSILRGEKICLFGDLTDDKASEVVKRILELKEEGRSKITFIIDSKGGSLSAYIKIKNIIEVTGMEVDTICIGYAFSTAACIFTLGESRIMYGKDSKLLFHEPSGKISGNYSSILDQVKDMQAHYEQIIDAIHYTIKSRFCVEIDIFEKVEKEWMLTAEEAYEYGFATGIVTNWK